jgi:hypothetical protein
MKNCGMCSENSIPEFIGGKMKDYHTKKFFYNFYWRKSFRNALLGHFGWTLFLAAVLMPLGYAAFRLSNWGGVAALIPLALIAFIHLAVIWILAMYGLLRSVCRRRARLLTLLLVFFNGLMPLAMAWYIVKKRAWAAGICCAGLLAGEIVLGAVGQSFSWGCRLLVLLACALFYLIMLLTLPDRRKLNCWFLLPLVLTGGVIASVYMYNKHLESVISGQEKEIARLVGFSIQRQDFIEANQKALSLKASPIAGLLVKEPFSLRSDEDLRKEVNEFITRNPGFQQAVNALDTVEVFDIKEDDLSEKNLMIGGNLQYMSRFRCAARFIAAEMKLNAADKEFVARCNQRLIKLRDILYADHGSMLIGRLVGLAVDGIRFDALAAVIGQGGITPEKAVELAGTAPDMRRIIAASMADEATNAAWIWECLQDLKVLAVLASNGDGDGGRSLKDVPPWERWQDDAQTNRSKVGARHNEHARFLWGRGARFHALKVRWLLKIGVRFHCRGSFLPTRFPQCSSRFLGKIVHQQSNKDSRFPFCCKCGAVCPN